MFIWIESSNSSVVHGFVGIAGAELLAADEQELAEREVVALLVLVELKSHALAQLFVISLVLCLRSSFTKSLNLAEDRIGRRGPHKRFRVLVVVL